MCPAQGVVCAYAGPVRPGRAPTGGARSPRTRRAPGGSTPTVLPRQHACPAGLPPGAHARAVRPDVLLRTDPPPRLDHPARCARATRAHAAGAPQLRSGPQAARRRETAARPRGPRHARRLGLAPAGRPPAPRARPRARAHAAPRPARAGRDRSGGPLAPQDAGRASPVVGHASSARLDRPGTGSWWDRAVDRHRPEAQEPCAGRVPGRPHRPRPPPTRVGAPAAAGLGSPWAGGWRPAPAQARVARTPRASHPARLHPPDGQRGPPRRGSDPPPPACVVLGERAALGRLHGPASRATGGDRRLRRQRRTRQDRERGRPARLGGQRSDGETCRASPDRSHAGPHRPGPTGPQDPAEPWLDHHTRLRRPVPHVRVPWTRPAALSALVRRHQPPLAPSRVPSSAAAFQARAWEPRGIGGSIGRVGVLQTWTRARRDPPHGPALVAGGGLAAAGAWLPARHDVLVHGTPWSVSFRAPCREPRHTTALCPLVEAPVWTTDGVVPGAPVGRGKDACRSLAPSRWRVAIRHHRRVTLDDGRVTCQDKASATAPTPSAPVPAAACLRRVLPPVLPDRGLHGRDDGFLSPGNRHGRTRLRA